jgi:hypothetical protein
MLCSSSESKGQHDAATASLPPRPRHLSTTKEKYCRVRFPQQSVCQNRLREDSHSAPGRQTMTKHARMVGLCLDIIDLNILASGALVLALASVLVELEVAVAIALLAVRVRLVDLGALGEFAVGFERARLVGTVLEDHVAFLVLVVAEREQDDVALVDPDLLAQLAANMCEALGAIEAERLEATVAEHFQNLCIFWLASVGWRGNKRIEECMRLE